MHEVNQAARRIEALRSELGAMLPLPLSVLASIQAPYDYELTYTSNAIEGNALTQRETELVIAHGTTIGGKNVIDHMEALDHHDALKWMYSLAAEDQPLTTMPVRQLHQIVLMRTHPDIAGQFAISQRRVGGSSVVFPPASQVAPLMTDFGDDLQRAEMAPHNAFDAHRRLVTIHPFDDGNGRTARLLMNLMLVRGGYRPVAVRPADRLEYLDALEVSQLKGEDQRFQALMYRRLEETMLDYVHVVREAVENMQHRLHLSEKGLDSNAARSNGVSAAQATHRGTLGRD